MSPCGSGGSPGPTICSSTLASVAHMSSQSSALEAGSQSAVSTDCMLAWQTPSWRHSHRTEALQPVQTRVAPPRPGSPDRSREGVHPASRRHLQQRQAPCWAAPPPGGGRGAVDARRTLWQAPLLVRGGTAIVLAKRQVQVLDIDCWSQPAVVHRQLRQIVRDHGSGRAHHARTRAGGGHHG